MDKVEEGIILAFGAVDMSREELLGKQDGICSFCFFFFFFFFCRLAVAGGEIAF